MPEPKDNRGVVISGGVVTAGQIVVGNRAKAITYSDGASGSGIARQHAGEPDSPGGPQSARAVSSTPTTDASRVSRAARVFVSYAHEDDYFRAELGKHLHLLEREGLVTTWHDRMLTAGQTWSDEIDAHLEEADFVLLLVSADFMNSPYCVGTEMCRALARHRNGDAVVVPIIVRPVFWQSSEIGRLQALPEDAKPISEWPQLDTALTSVVLGLRTRLLAWGAEDRPTR